MEAISNEGAIFDAELVSSSRLFQEEIAHQREHLALLAEQRKLDRGLVERLSRQSQPARFAAIVESRR